MLPSQRNPIQIKITELRDPLEINILGDEAWLRSIYQSFLCRADGSHRDTAGTLTGSLRIMPVPGDIVNVTGRIKYTPPITCGRCGDDIDWPIDAQINVYYETEDPEARRRREVNLLKGDLERYFIEDGVIDLEPLINETVQMDISTSCVRESEDKTRCLVCDADLSSPMVYRVNTQAAKNSPFAALGAKNLKH